MGETVLKSQQRAQLQHTRLFPKYLTTTNYTATEDITIDGVYWAISANASLRLAKSHEPPATLDQNMYVAQLLPAICRSKFQKQT